jgi:hypothetical protein
MARGKTRKSKKSLTIPALRQSFAHMETIAKSLSAAVAAKKKTVAAAAQEYAREWKRVFHRSLPLKSAQAAISFASSARPTRKQRGGSAPLNYDMRAGINTAPTLPGQTDAAGYTLHAQVPQYVASGFDKVLWQDSLSTTCNNGNDPYTPAPYADIGNNAVVPPGAGGALSASTVRMSGGRRRTYKRGKKQRGGMAALSDAFNTISGAVQGATYGAVSSTNPTGVIHDSITAMRGLPLPASPDATDPSWAYKMSPQSIKYADMNAGAIERAGSLEVFP